MRYLLTLAYDGTRFCGWQKQLNGLSIQQVVSDALEMILQHRISLVGSGRTDAGVHARAQTAHFDTEKAPPLPKLHASLNALLPSDIRILSVEPVDAHFHACSSATGKIYTYQFDFSPIQSPLSRLYSYRPPHPLDLDRLQKAAYHFIGTHDFTTFANLGSQVLTTVRTIYSITLCQDHSLVFHGNGFLYKMVRNLVGALLVAGKGDPIDIPHLLAQRDRRLAPPPAPAHALFLTRVLYESS